MLDKLISFPLFKNDGKGLFKLNKMQQEALNSYKKKIDTKEYILIKNFCLCGNKDDTKDILISEKDVHSIASKNVLCKECSLIRVDNILDTPSLHKFYENEYRNIYGGIEYVDKQYFDLMTSEKSRSAKLFNFVKNIITLDNVETVFEVGCGGGWNLYPYFLLNKKISGCDYGYKFLEYPKSIGMNTLYSGSLNDIKTPDNSQDLIILSHVMEHFTNPIQELQAIIKKVKENKYLLIEVPDVFFKNKKGRTIVTTFQNIHLYDFNKKYLENFYKELGLEIIYIDDTSVALLKKPKNYKHRDIDFIKSESLDNYYLDIEIYLKKRYVEFLLIHPLRRLLIDFLDYIGIKDKVKIIKNKYFGV